MSEREVRSAVPLRDGDRKLIAPFLAPSEQVRFVTRPHVLTVIWRLAQVGVLIVAGVGVLLTFREHEWVRLGAAAWTLVWLAVFGYRYVAWRRHVYVLTDKNVYERWGVIIFRKRVIVIRHITNHAADERALLFGVFNRIFNFGDVTICTAHDGAATVFELVAQHRQFDDALSAAIAGVDSDLRDRDGAGGQAS